MTRRRCLLLRPLPRVVVLFIVILFVVIVSLIINFGFGFLVVAFLVRARKFLLGFFFALSPD